MYLFRSHIFHSSLWQHPRRSFFLIDKKIIDPTKTQKLEPEYRGEKTIYLQLPIPSMGLVYLPTFGWLFKVNVGKYISPMDGMGLPSTFFWDPGSSLEFPVQEKLKLLKDLQEQQDLHPPPHSLKKCMKKWHQGQPRTNFFGLPVFDVKQKNLLQFFCPGFGAAADPFSPQGAGAKHRATAERLWIAPWKFPLLAGRAFQGVEGIGRNRVAIWSSWWHTSWVPTKKRLQLNAV